MINEQKIIDTINKHRKRVFDLMAKISQDVMQRGNDHDLSKYDETELPTYARVIEEFEKCPYGSVGYWRAKDSLGDTVKHHHEKNRHHPEHFHNGIDGMNLVDLLEMLCDWKSATQNHPEHPGDMQNSIKIAIEKYKISPQLAQVLYNTMKDFDLT